MAHEELPRQLEVPLSSLIELAVESWRLEGCLAEMAQTASVPKGRHIARRLQKFLAGRELTVLDLTGRKYEPGMSVEVLEATEDESLGENDRMIDEMVEPIVMWRGRVVKFGQVVIRQGARGTR
jgi:hypothetical protein